MAASITARTWGISAVVGVIFVVVGLSARAASAGEVTVGGWPLAAIPLEGPPSDFGDDPVIGRQICPPLTRLNLKTKSAEGIVLRRAVEEFRGEKKGSLWRLEVRTGIFWWSGAPVNSEDIAKYLIANLNPILIETYGTVFTIPAHEITATDSHTVTIDWKTPPPFGPYVFNGMPLFRKVSEGFADLKYECVGNYRPESLQPLVLMPASGYVFGARLPKVRFLTESETRADIKFVFSKNPDSKSVQKCNAIWSSPFFSVISWNLYHGPAAKVDFRKLMTGLIPRKEIISAGILTYSDVVSAPIPRMHPGFSPTAIDMSFNAAKVSTALDALGFRRKKPYSTRTDGKGNPLRLQIINNRKDEGLVEKLISDSFSSVGLEVDFIEALEAGMGPDQIDGYFTTLHTDYPKIDFLTLLHMQTPSVDGFWKVKDPEFLKKLEKYALTLTTEKPDFSLLSSIHQYLASNQIYSVIAHHRACIKTADAIKLSPSGVNNGDPDWFRDLLF